ncbi:MAG: hypothetical protein WBA74_22480 [Cyclobacteriaceae bacterium]
MKNKINTGYDKQAGHLPDIGSRSYAFTIWLGAMIRWVGRLGSKDFSALYTPQSDNKNMFIGYLTTIIFITIFMTILIFYGIR